DLATLPVQRHRRLAPQLLDVITKERPQPRIALDRIVACDREVPAPIVLWVGEPAEFVATEVPREHERRAAFAHAALLDVQAFALRAVAAVLSGPRAIPHPVRDRIEIELLHALDRQRGV